MHVLVFDDVITFFQNAFIYAYQISYTSTKMWIHIRAKRKETQKVRNNAPKRERKQPYILFALKTIFHVQGVFFMYSDDWVLLSLGKRRSTSVNSVVAISPSPTTSWSTRGHTQTRDPSHVTSVEKPSDARTISETIGISSCQINSCFVLRGCVGLWTFWPWFSTNKKCFVKRFACKFKKELI